MSNIPMTHSDRAELIRELRLTLEAVDKTEPIIASSETSRLIEIHNECVFQLKNYIAALCRFNSSATMLTPTKTDHE